jgi:hypothetical protein
MIRWISLAFGASFIVLCASILGCLATMLDAVEWNGFFVRSGLGSFAMVVLFGVAEGLLTRR